MSALPEVAAPQRMSSVRFTYEYTSDVAVYVVYDRKTNRVLMEWRTPPWPPCNLWCFGSGRVDNTDDNQMAAAVRELCEELGLVATEVHELGVIYNQTGRAFYPFMVTEWTGEMPTENADQGYPLGWFKLSQLPTNAINDVTRTVANLVADHLADDGPYTIVDIEAVA